MENLKPFYVTWDGDGGDNVFISIGPHNEDGADAIAFSQNYSVGGIPDDVSDAFVLMASAPVMAEVLRDAPAPHSEDVVAWLHAYSRWYHGERAKALRDAGVV